MDRTESKPNIRPAWVMPCGNLASSGRVTVPRALLEYLQWEPGDPMEALLTDDGLGVTIYSGEDICLHCGEKNREALITIERGRKRKRKTCICLECAAAMERERLRLQQAMR